ncbi:hypothetical protein GCM10023226_07140 [Nocardioides nanhaiensis]|uniref:Uncharacterized protein n=1 Tax=Nocardioides nanhaiensis TaxID=1476871 RepID=A0ABP8VUT8_9ACTN
MLGGLLMAALMMSSGVQVSAHATAPTDAAQAAAAPTAAKKGMTGQEYWRLNDTCRGESDPAVYRPACRKRDRFLKTQGRRVAAKFHQAWKRDDRATMRRLTAPSSRYALQMFKDRPARKTAPDCSYSGSWYCFFKGADGYWVGARFEVTRYEYPRLPRWQMTGAAPDA